ncbi:MAG TPA: YfhO family protein, partial [Cyclobacteriaceae bacterium]|nr:YfhO family protein [Cyclobacteriaceae bacterium]
QSSDSNMANQLARYTSAYWGPQSLTAPYYGGAVICFLFVVGMAFAEKKYVWWLVPVSALGAMLSWGSHFEAFNYFVFDYLPGYNKFRSVTFAIMITLFSMPLLGMLGLERFFEEGLNPKTRKKLVLAFSFTGGLCLLIGLFAGMASFMREGETQLPAWFLHALKEDRESLMRADAFRSFSFILAVFLLLFFDARKWVSAFGVYAFLVFVVAIDLSVVDKRYFTDDNYQRKRESHFVATAADQEVMKDKSVFRVYNLQEPFSTEGRSAYFHHSLGGYHGAKIRRYQDLYDSCLGKETNRFIADAQAGQLQFRKYGVMNMLNTKYIMYGPDKGNIIPNPEANGNAWFVGHVDYADSPSEELAKVCKVDTRTTAVVDRSKFKVGDVQEDSLASVQLIEMSPPYLKYQASSAKGGLVVFSEIYYPRGWTATIDGKEAPILRADYVLRALEVPAGNHQIEFRFAPKPYVIGNKITMASSWALLLVVLGSIGWALRKGQ